MAYFNKEFLEFFRELSENNHKSWFDENRKRYETQVKKPFQSLVTDLILRIHGDDPDVMITSREAIFRINRDIRFSPDKRPYKTQVSALISPAGRKDMAYPGLYIELSPRRVMIAGGAYMPDKEQLLKIRRFIVAKPDVLAGALKDKTFSKTFGGIKGDKLKRLPKEFTEAAESQPLLYNKQFYYDAELPPETVLKEDLSDILMAHYHAAKPMMSVLREAMRYRH